MRGSGRASSRPSALSRQRNKTVLHPARAGQELRLPLLISSRMARRTKLFDKLPNVTVGPAAGDLESSQHPRVEKESSKKRLADTLSDKLFEKDRLDRQLERHHVTGEQAPVVVGNKPRSLTVCRYCLLGCRGYWHLPDFWGDNCPGRAGRSVASCRSLERSLAAVSHGFSSHSSMQKTECRSLQGIRDCHSFHRFH